MCCNCKSKEGTRSGADLIKNYREQELTAPALLPQKRGLAKHWSLSTAARTLLEPSLAWRVSRCPPEWDLEKWALDCNKSYKDRLIQAGALIAAKLDRINETP